MKHHSSIPPQVADFGQSVDEHVGEAGTLKGGEVNETVETKLGACLVLVSAWFRRTNKQQFLFTENQGMRTQRIFSALIGALIACIATVAQAAEKPNIVVIWGDDIGISNVSAYSEGLMG
jgi:hypothetical protein